MSCFSNEFNKSKEFINLSESVNADNAPVGVIGLSDVSKCFVAHSLCQKGEKSFIIILYEKASLATFTLFVIEEGLYLWK